MSAGFAPRKILSTSSAERGALGIACLMPLHLIRDAGGSRRCAVRRKRIGRNDLLGTFGAERVLVPMHNTGPRTFKEIVAAQEPTEMARFDRFVDPSVNPFHGEVSVNEDRSGTGEWRVEYFDDNGGCYVTIFAGPAAEGRARDYFMSLKSGRLSIQREPLPQ